MFLRLLKYLLPNARAWQITQDKQLRQFFDGLSGLGSNIRTYFDQVYLDLFPETTRELDTWENNFGLPGTLTVEQERRDRLAAAWQAIGGQSPRYIQDTLRAAGFDVYVHEWWELPVVGSPVARNPFTYLNDGTGGFSSLMNDGAADTQDGDVLSQDGSSGEPLGFALVNKVFEGTTGSVGDGAANMNDGAADAQDGDSVVSWAQKLYPIPADPTKYPFFFYIGGQTFPDHATVLTSRKNEFETLCLKICPTQLWLGMLITYV